MKKKYLSLKEAMTLLIQESRNNIWAPYQIGSLLFHLYQEKEAYPFLLKIRNITPARIDYKRVVSDLIKFDVLKYKNRKIFYRLPEEKFVSGEITCSVDPFSYISHHSAMVFHDLTKQVSAKTYLSSFPSKLWSQKAILLMKDHFGENYKTYRDCMLPILKNLDVSNIEKPNGYIYRSANIGSFKSYDYKKIKVSSIDRTFLDMIRRPDLCGGINNVLKVYKRTAPSYINPIIKEIDTFGNKIEKIRAGYILEEICGITNEIIESWKKNAMRGGSRKLDPFAEYAPIFSEQWQLSLNIEELYPT